MSSAILTLKFPTLVPLNFCTSHLASGIGDGVDILEEVCKLLYHFIQSRHTLWHASVSFVSLDDVVDVLIIFIKCGGNYESRPVLELKIQLLFPRSVAYYSTSAISSVILCDARSWNFADFERAAAWWAWRAWRVTEGLNEEGRW